MPVALPTRRARPALTPGPPPAHRQLVLLALIVTLVAAVAGCAKGDELATGPTTPGTAAPTTNRAAGAGAVGGSAGATAPVAPASPTTAMGSSGTTLAGPTTSTGRAPGTLAPETTTAGVAGSSSDAAFCQRNSQTTSDFQNLDPSHDFGAYLAKVRQVTSELVALAPPEIKADVQAVADAFSRITSPEQMDTMANNPTLKAASDRVSDWTRTHCPAP